MKRRLKFAVLASLIGLASAQLIQPDMHNSPVNPARRLWNGDVNPRVAGIMRRACGNCHSHDTQWPWYARISRVSWFLARHVTDGRAKLNFDEWPAAAAAADQLEEIYDSIAKRKMLRASYPEARLSQADRDAVLAWAIG
jgi:hypothetical protein